MTDPLGPASGRSRARSGNTKKCGRSGLWCLAIIWVFYCSSTLESLSPSKPCRPSTLACVGPSKPCLEAMCPLETKGTLEAMSTLETMSAVDSVRPSKPLVSVTTCRRPRMG